MKTSGLLLLFVSSLVIGYVSAQDVASSTLTASQVVRFEETLKSKSTYVSGPYIASSTGVLQVVPTSVFAKNGVVVVDDNSNVVPHLYTVKDYIVPVRKSLFSLTHPELTDDDRMTGVKLPFSKSSSTLRLLLKASSSPLYSGAVTFLYKSAPPEAKVSLYAIKEGVREVVFEAKPLVKSTYEFPLIASGEWEVVIFSPSSFSLQEILFKDAAEKTEVLVRHEIRFKAAKGAYKIYGGFVEKISQDEPDETVQVVIAKELVELPFVYPVRNLSFVDNDKDKDGIPNVADNCPLFSNEDQEDKNKNGKGDMCDDDDADGTLNAVDNCRFDVNKEQRDVDADGVGDECDSESLLIARYPWLKPISIVGTLLLIAVYIQMKIRRGRIHF